MISNKILTVLFFIFLLSMPISAQISTCAECNARFLNDKDIKDKSLEELNLLRNEIYARKGYQFDKAEYSRYFENQRWYKPLGDNKQVVLSDIEKRNVDFLKDKSKEISRRRTLALANLKELKTALNANDPKTIEKYIPKDKQISDYGSDIISGLGSILNMVELNLIHWNKNSGIYKVSVDDGYSISYNMILFEKNYIIISGSDISSHSEIFGDFDDGYSDYMSEDESATFYTFEITENGIKFKDVQFAG